MSLVAVEPALRAPNAEAPVKKQNQVLYLNVRSHHLSSSATSSRHRIAGQRSPSMALNTQLPRALLGGAHILRGAEVFYYVTGGQYSPWSSLGRGV